MSATPLSDAELAAQLALGAGRLLMQVRSSGLLAQQALGKAGDAVSHQFLLHALRHARPGDAVLSEEMNDDGARLTQQRVWIIDPVDGTREYGEDRSDWAVHVALAIDGEASVGAVALPGLDEVLRSDQARTVPTPGDPLRMVVSRTRPAKEAVAIAEKLGAKLVAMGSAGAKAMAILRGEADIYLHSGGQYEWDSAAPVAVARAHGLHCSRIDGSALRYNSREGKLPDLLICRNEHAAPVLQLLREVAREP